MECIKQLWLSLLLRWHGLYRQVFDTRNYLFTRGLPQRLEKHAARVLEAKLKIALDKQTDLIALLGKKEYVVEVLYLDEDTAPLVAVYRAELGDVLPFGSNRTCYHPNLLRTGQFRFFFDGARSRSFEPLRIGRHLWCIRADRPDIVLQPKAPTYKSLS